MDINKRKQKPAMSFQNSSDGMPVICCSICAKIGRPNEAAVNYCTVCYEFMCAGCINEHKKFAPNRAHKLLNQKEMIAQKSSLSKSIQQGSDDVNFCVCTLCSNLGINKVALKYCVECSAYMCDECLQQHNKFTSLSLHQVMMSDKWKATDSEKEGPVVCTACNTAGKTIEAVTFCVECTTFMCTSCVDHHEKFPTMKSHHLFKQEEKQKTMLSKNKVEGGDISSVHHRRILELETIVEVMENTIMGWYLEIAGEKPRKSANTDDHTEQARLKRFEKTIYEIKQFYQNEFQEGKRLSKIAGAKLTDASAIADLSDTNRPTKLSEKFSELFDNEWTDAFGDLHDKYKISEEVAIQMLLNIVQEAYKFCDEISRKQHVMLKTALLCPVLSMQSSHVYIDIGPVYTKMISDLRKETADVSVADVMRYFIKTQKALPADKNCTAYINKCIKLCWLMFLQSPPVFVDVRVGEKFDKDKLKTYTKAGSRVAFLVWPPLYLEKGGSLLSKGVAQGK